MPKERRHQGVGESWPDRKAHASLAHVEGRFVEGLKSAHPGLVDAQGDCPQCVSLEHALADPNLADQAARELA